MKTVLENGDERKRQRIKNCLKKRAYRNETAALKVIYGKGLRNKLQPYICPVCGEWHIGHIIPRWVRLG